MAYTNNIPKFLRFLENRRLKLRVVKRVHCSGRGIVHLTPPLSFRPQPLSQCDKVAVLGPFSKQTIVGSVLLRHCALARVCVIGDGVTMSSLYDVHA